MERGIKAVLVFMNGMIAVLDSKGKQIPRLQISTRDLWIRFARDCDYDFRGACFETPDGHIEVLQDPHLCPPLETLDEPNTGAVH